MPLDLSGCHAKIERAKKHTSEFDRERVAFLDTKPYVVVTKYNPKSDATESIMGPLPIMPTILSTTVGDAIRNLRSASRQHRPRSRVLAVARGKYLHYSCPSSGTD